VPNREPAGAAVLRATVTWPSVFAAFVACHLVGDLLLQTEWQALTKVHGFGDPEGRRALIAHAATYTLAFLPALVWVAIERGLPRAVLVAALVAVPHLVIDDGHFVRGWMRRVKHAPRPSASLSLMVDQSFHAVCLLGAAAVAAA
jgi:Protein of unknown function (DUF3307)